MTAILLAPVALSALLLAAHFIRAGTLLATVGLLGLVPLLAVRRRWVPVVTGATLWLGAALWVRTTVRFAADRIRLGQPWLRMAIILGGVAAFTLLSSLVLRTVRLRVWYRGVPPASAAPGG